MSTFILMTALLCQISFETEGHVGDRFSSFGLDEVEGQTRVLFTKDNNMRVFHGLTETFFMCSESGIKAKKSRTDLGLGQFSRLFVGFDNNQVLVFDNQCLQWRSADLVEEKTKEFGFLSDPQVISPMCADYNNYKLYYIDMTRDELEETHHLIKLDLITQKVVWKKKLPRFVEILSLDCLPNEKKIVMGSGGFESWSADQISQYLKQEKQENLVKASGEISLLNPGNKESRYWIKSLVETVTILDSESGTIAKVCKGRAGKAIENLTYLDSNKSFLTTTNNLGKFYKINKDNRITSAGWLKPKKYESTLALFRVSGNSSITPYFEHILSDGFYFNKDESGRVLGIGSTKLVNNNYFYDISIWHIPSFSSNQTISSKMTPYAKIVFRTNDKPSGTSFVINLAGDRVCVLIDKKIYVFHIVLPKP